MRYLMPPYRAEYSFGPQVGKMHESAGEKAEPYVHRDKAENVVKGQKSKELQPALIVLFKELLPADKLGGVGNLPGKFLGGVGAELDALGGAGGHNEDLGAEFAARVLARWLRLGKIDRHHRETPPLGDDGSRAAGAES